MSSASAGGVGFDNDDNDDNDIIMEDDDDDSDAGGGGFDAGVASGGGGGGGLKNGGSGQSAAVLGLRDVIIAAEKHEPTANEYLMYIFKFLGSASEVGGVHLADMLKFFAEVIPSASGAVVKAVYKPAADKLLQLARSCRDDDVTHAKVLKYSLASLGALLQHFSSAESVWDSLQGMSTLNALLLFLEVPNQSIRKVCRNNLIDIMKAHKKAKFNFVADHVASHILDVFGACSRSEYKRSLAFVEFLQKSLSLIPDKTATSVFQAAIQLHACEQPLLSSSVYCLFDHYFQSSHSTMDIAHTKQVLSYLVGQRPQTPDMEAHCYYYNSMASCLIYLYKHSKEEGKAVIHGVVSAMINGFETEFAQIHSASLDSIRRVISFTFFPDEVVGAMAMADPSSSYIWKVIESLDAILHLRYQQSWVKSLECFRFVYGGFNQTQNRFFLSKYLEKVSDIYQAIELGSLPIAASIKRSIQDVLGTALVAFGPEAFLEAVPLLGPEDPQYIGVNDTREWVLVLLQSYLKHAPCTLEGFGNTALKHAQMCSAAIKNPESVGVDSTRMTDAQIRRFKVAGNRVVQFWSLFPLYCTNCPTDLSTSFPQLLPLLEEAMDDEAFPEVRLQVARAVSTLVKSCKAKYSIAAGSALSNVALPADLAVVQSSMVLFVQHLLRDLDSIDISDERFRPMVEDLAEMISISPTEIVGQVAKHLLQSLLTTTEITPEVERRAASWMTTLLAIVNYLPAEIITIFHRTISPYLKQTSSEVLQKRGYKIMDTLVKTHPSTIFGHESRDTLIAAVKASVISCHVSVRGIRLQFLRSLICSISDAAELATQANNLMTEILTSIKDANQKPRDAAFDLLEYLVENMPSSAIFSRVIPHLNSDLPAERSAALMAISLLIKKRRDDAGLMTEITTMLPNVTSLLRDANGALSTPEQIRAVLTFLQVSCLVLPLSNLQASLAYIVGAITRGLGSEQGNYAAFCRNIYRKLLKKVDKEQIRSLIPETEQNLLNHILRMSRRSERKKLAEAKKDRMEEFLVDDEDSDDDNLTIGGSVLGGAAGGGNPFVGNGKVGGGLMSRQRPKATRVQDFNLELSEDILRDGVSDILASSSAPGGGRSAKAGGIADKDDGEDDGFELVENEQGKFVVKETKKRKSREEEEGGEQEQAPTESATLAQGVSFNGAKDRKIQPERKRMAPGSEYRSKKAGGDVWRKGTLEPHAFIPLDPRLLTTKKSREKGIALMQQVVNHKGAGGAGGGGGGNSKPVRGQTANKKQRESHRRHGKA